MTTTTRDMAALFAGHTGGYFAQHPSPRCVRQPVTLGLVNDHLRGLLEIGTYPVRPNGACRWGCIDIDGESDGSDDAARHADAMLVHRAWTAAGVVSWVERSRSKGYHVWVFAAAWMSAVAMRDAGRVINRSSGVDSPEVNPKNPRPWTTSNGFVNTVRMPYPGGANPGRMVVLDGHRELSAGEFARRAMASRTDPAVLSNIATGWVTQAAPTHPLYEKFRALYGAGSDLGAARGASSQDAAQIVRGDRRIVKGERDTQFHTIARYLFARGIPFGQAMSEVEQIWRHRCDNAGYDLSAALEKVERVYG